MEIVQSIPTRAKIVRAWLTHAQSFDRCVFQSSRSVALAKRIAALGTRMMCEVNNCANFVTSSYQKISGFDRPHVSEMLSDSKISTLESGFKNFRICLRIRRMRVDDSRIRKEKVADSKISGYVWTGPEFVLLANHEKSQSRSVSLSNLLCLILEPFANH